MYFAFYICSILSRSHSFANALLIVHAASNVQAEATKREINTRFAKKAETKNNFSVHARSKKHLGLKRIIGHHHGGRAHGEIGFPVSHPEKLTHDIPYCESFLFYGSKFSIHISNGFRSLHSPQTLTFFQICMQWLLKQGNPSTLHPYELQN